MGKGGWMELIRSDVFYPYNRLMDGLKEKVDGESIG